MKPTVLLVDDEPNILYAAMRNLHKQPFLMLTATDAKSARLILQTRHVDLVVTDENMPGQSGTELLMWVMEHLPKVVRIVLTGQPSVDVAMRAINEASVFRFLRKPCRPFDLAMAIREGLESLDDTPEVGDLQGLGSDGCLPSKVVNANAQGTWLRALS
ncbi:MAG: response regulator [Planctomycetota bacterium]|nr:response regulator [Planctomycetota bacterium]